MANYSREKITVVRQRFTLVAPSNLAEVYRMASGAMGAYREQFAAPGKLADDAITVTVEDEMLVFSWEVEE